MEENSKKDTLSRKALFLQFLQKTPIECYLSNKKLKSKSGYTWHLKKCSQNVHVSQQNKAEPISPTAIAPPLPTSFPIIVSPTLITPTDTMKTSPTALTTVTSLNNFFHTDNNNPSRHPSSPLLTNGVTAMVIFLKKI